MHLQISLSYWNQRRYDESIEWANKSLELDPRHLLACEHLAGAYWKKGDYDRHMVEAIRHAEDCGAPGELLDELKRVYAEGGRAAVVRYSLSRMASAGGPRPVPGTSGGRAAVGLSARRSAVQQLPGSDGPTSAHGRDGRAQIRHSLTSDRRRSGAGARADD